MENTIQQGIGSRLAEERNRLGHKQREMAELMGVSTTTQGGYERGEVAPTAMYLRLAQEQGVDVLYVITGAPSPGYGFRNADGELTPMSSEEAYLLGNYRACSDSKKQELLEASAILANPPPKRPRA